MKFLENLADPVQEFLSRKFTCRTFKCTGVKYVGCLTRRSVLPKAGGKLNGKCKGAKCDQGDDIEAAFSRVLDENKLKLEDVREIVANAKYGRQVEEKPMKEKQEARVCAHEHCMKRLRSDSVGDFCAQHRPKKLRDKSVAPTRPSAKRVPKPKNRDQEGAPTEKRGRPAGGKSASGNGTWAEFQDAVKDLAEAQGEFTAVAERVEAATDRVHRLAEEVGTVIPVSEIPNYIDQRLN